MTCRVGGLKVTVAKENIYAIQTGVQCLKCGNKGAVRFVGIYYPIGLKEDLDECTYSTQNAYKKYRDQCYVSPAMGFGGTIPYQCLNCGNYGLIDMDGLEGYKKAFETIF